MKILNFKTKTQIMANNQGPDFYEVERIEGFKFENDALKFLVKWKGYPWSIANFEGIENVKDCVLFINYVHNLYQRHEQDIIANRKIMERKLEQQISTILMKPKAEIMLELDKFDAHKFNAYEAVYHVIPPNETFDKQFDQMFCFDFILQLQEKLEEQFEKLEEEILKKEEINVTIENEFDFDTIESFDYITENVWPTDSEADSTTETVGIEKTCKPPSLSLFKRVDGYWSLKALVRFNKNQFITKCVGEVLPASHSRALSKRFASFPIDIEDSGKFYRVDASKKGNLSRFVKHHDKPNAEIVAADDIFIRRQQLVMIASRDILPGEEITIDYERNSQRRHDRHSGIMKFIGFPDIVTFYQLCNTTH